MWFFKCKKNNNVVKDKASKSTDEASSKIQNKQTSPSVTKKAVDILHDDQYSKTSKSLAGSALSQSNSNKKSSQKEASKASKVLKDKRFSQESKSVAASVLSQTPSKKTAKK
ncbi:hypothetical protein [Mesoplasma corruscae]|uniref:Uncharacterized protein n=1 Tax=Mesoplasma corruscae TaxID=216874 RepID=A0A2S5RGC9_9MOLU|nr:hypothetical protein [Mesoplasma corruscae]PPE06347.1 hypothetical protein MCORR_v1c06520 [Mesoplasma corruscae]